MMVRSGFLSLSAALVWSGLMVGCAEGDPLGVDVADLDLTWQGQFEGHGGCLDGDISLTVEADHDLGVTGVYRYESLQDCRSTVMAEYEVSGVIQEDGTLALEQTSLLDADIVPFGRWCFGALHLSLYPGSDVEGPEVMAGSWVGENCDCEGNIDLTADEG